MAANEDDGLTRLGVAVIARRRRLSARQEDITARGGPSDRTLRSIENGTSAPLSSSTLRKLDMGLMWDVGTSAAVISGTLTADEAVHARYVDTVETGLRTSTFEELLRAGIESGAGDTTTGLWHRNPANEAAPSSRARSIHAYKPLAQALETLQSIARPTAEEEQAIEATSAALHYLLESNRQYRPGS